MDLFTHHLSQPRGGPVYPDVDHLGQGVELQLVQDRRHLGALGQASNRVHCKFVECISRQRLLQKCRPTSRARVTTSTWWLAEMTARGIPGESASISAAS